MARIRTIKPDFFRHAGLFELEQETGLPIRVAFAGLWTAADRSGRFKWSPRALKLDCLPFDDCDFSRVLDALCTRGHIVRYADSDGREYGYIPSWNDHQTINNRESQSVLPDPEDCQAITTTCTRESRVVDATPTRHDLAPVEGKGREGKGREGKGREGKEVATRDASPPISSSATWEAYSSAYARRYHAEPVRNAKVNSQLKQLVDRLGFEEAPKVAAFFVGHEGPFYVRSMHAVDLLVKDAEKLRTEWATGRGSSSSSSTKNAQAMAILGFDDTEVIDA